MVRCVEETGVLLLDNWYREADGNVYSWLSTCGRAEAQFSEGMIERLLDQALENVDEDPYGAYREYVTLFAQAMTQGMDTRVEIPISVSYTHLFRHIHGTHDGMGLA